MANTEDPGSEAESTPAAESTLPLGPQPLPELIDYRTIEDAATMKALADPLRLRIMRVLGRDVRVEPRIMTVKQLADELGEPTTKLYRHIKQLLAAGLIQVAELRLVGGIVEQSYRVAQAGFAVEMGSTVTTRERPLPEVVYSMVGAAVDEFFTRYEAALREGRTFVRKEDNLVNSPYVRSVATISDYRVPRERAAEFAERLHALVGEFNDGERANSGDGVSANLMVMFYATEPGESD